MDIKRWLHALCAEMRYMNGLSATTKIETIFFGGGTPSLMPPSMVKALIEEARHLWDVTPDCEITLEANPTSSEAAHFEQYRWAGVNRLSLGVQALNDQDLVFLGREHSAGEALEVLELVAQYFNRCSFDLIYARPEQTVEAWQKELGRALDYVNGHISLYQLTVEPDTPFARLYKAGGFELPDDDIAASLYEVTHILCSDAGLQRYEVSNYASSGQESRHNLAYWKGNPYIGIGPGAHGRYQDSHECWYATSTIKSPERWLSKVEHEGHGMELHEVVTSKVRAEEYLLSGLRLSEGVVMEFVQDVINQSKLTQLEALQLVEQCHDMLRVTREGEPLLERIISELLL